MCARRGRIPHHSHHLYLHRRDEDYSYISPCVKYFLFFFNLIFWLIGGTLMALGGWSFLEEYPETDLKKFEGVLDLFIHVSLALVILGLIVFLMSFAGCLGALRENLCFLKLYSLMLLLLFIGEIVLSTVAFIFPNTVSYFLKDKLSKDPIMKYRDDTNLQNLIDVMQMNFKCCGISDQGYKDWNRNIYFNCNESNPSPERCAVPFSCCRNNKNFDSGLINSMCGYSFQNVSSVVQVNRFIYTRGCIEAVTELFEKNMNYVAGVCLASAVVQLLAMFLARSLQGQIMAQQSR